MPDVMALDAQATKMSGFGTSLSFCDFITATRQACLVLSLKVCVVFLALANFELELAT